MALAWAGEDTGRILVVVTEEMFIFMQVPTVYLSTDDGKTFANITNRLNNGQPALIAKDNGLQKSPVNSRKIYLVAHTNMATSDLYITEDAADTFRRVELPFTISGNIEFHPTNENFLLVVDSAILYVSWNSGSEWKRVLSGVNQAKWSTSDTDPDGTIYVSHSPDFENADHGYYEELNMEKGLSLKKTTDRGGSWTQIHDDILTFGSQGRFLYASVKSPSIESSRFMKVSTDGGRTWNEALLPTVAEDEFYTILDMSEDLIFMHVDNPGDTGHGTLYTSDQTGIIFSESLEKHLYPNYGSVTDFYKVESIRGVYLASQLADDNSVHTMITFDRGGEWMPVHRPAGVPCKDENKECFLQIHNSFSISREVVAQPPLSIKNAAGIILVHGHVASALQTTPPDVFVTSDGGYTWTKALDGPHHYQIADHGGLLVAVPSSTQTPNVIKFSTDMGRCWHQYKFTESEDIIFTGLLTEPGGSSMSVSLWGFHQSTKEWRVHTIDFTKVITRPCLEDDYEEWMPHGDNSNDPALRGCLLGQKEVFKRLKADSWCANGHDYELSKERSTCHCTKDDYECDYGYHRLFESDTCVEDSEFKGGYLDICQRGHKEQIVTVGYRKIPGDRCEGGFHPAGEKVIDLHESCSDSKAVLLEQLKPGEARYITSGRKVHHGANTAVIIAIVLTTLLLAFVVVIYFVSKFNLLKRANVTYRYSSLSQSEEYDYDNDVENALAKHTSLYQDDSDDEVTNTRQSQDQASTSNGNVSRGEQRPKPKVKSYHDDSDDDMLI